MLYKSILLTSAAMLMMTLSACASSDHRDALALGAAGVSATQALSDQTSAVAKTVTALSPMWGVRDALACSAVQPSFRSDCLTHVTASPDPTLLNQLKSISDVLAKRKVAIDTLNQAYAAFVDLAKYNAGQAATSALKTSFQNINAFTSAAAALGPAGAAAPVISTTVETAAGIGVAFAADTREDRAIRFANADLETANKALVQGLTTERDAAASLLQTLASERAALGAALLNSGLLTPEAVLTPVVNVSYPGVTLSKATPDNQAVAMKAAQNALASQRVTAIAQAPKSYDDALATLSALEAQHQKLATKQPLTLDQVEGEVASLKADLAATPTN